jgi:hypothetical protein
MHNRARLVVGSFLTKDLGIDWRWGERHFMRLLVDGDEANNNGNWQWIASVGTNPQPVYRQIYNPTRQMEAHDGPDVAGCSPSSGSREVGRATSATPSEASSQLSLRPSNRACSSARLPGG